MAPRFGGSNAALAAQARMRFALGLLVVMIVMLFGVLLFVVTQMNSGGDPQAPVQVAATDDQAVGAPIMPTVDVLVAAAALAEGTQVTEALLGTKPEDQTLVPKGALLIRDRDQVLGMYAAKPINARQVLTRDDLSRFPPLSALKIPAGYRAVTITVDSRSGVEGWAKPETKVDVIFAFEENGAKKVVTLLRQIKVLSYAGAKNKDVERAEVGGKEVETTVTLQVTEGDAKKLELARVSGQLSLTLVSDEEAERDRDERPEVLGFDELIGKPSQVPQAPDVKPQPVEEEDEGIVYYTDPKTGEQKKLRLPKGRRRWVQDDNWE